MLHVHRADHADTLVAGLAAVLADPLDDAFAIDRVAVHSRGLERWLAQRLSHHLGAGDGRDDGICAAVDFPFPGHLIADVLSTATGIAPDEDPWRADRLAWPLLGLLEAEPGLANGTPLAGHLRGDDDVPADGRFAAVRRVADLFDRYAVHRPAMLGRWAAGDVAEPVLGDGRPIPDGGVWQAGMWRALRDHLAIPSPAERLGDAVTRLREDPALGDLPPRLSLFGLTALPASYLAVLRALAVHRDVHLFLLHPSPALWQRVERTLTARPPSGLPRRDDDPVRGTVVHPLLRAWGRDAREMQVVMHVTGDEPLGSAGDPLPPVTTPATSPTMRPLLARIQADIRGDVAPPGPPGRGQFDQRPVLATTDTSVQVHACHGRTRQVEVLRDLLLHRFAADPTLEPRDVLVLCPDIETFAPLVEAVFAPEPEPLDGSLPDARRLRASQLRIRVADRSLKRTNPLLRVVGDLLAAADGRIAATDVRDLAGRPPVRARFRLGDDDLDRLDTWIRDLGIRWGLDATHRSVHGIATDANTWHAGIQRLLIGVAVADEDQRTVGEVVPYDDVSGSDVELAGSVATLLAILSEATRRLAEPRTVQQWRDTIDAVVASFTDTRAEPWQRVQLTGVLDDVVRTAGGEKDTVALSLPEFRELIGRQLEGAAGRASHRTGDLIVCTLVPMRSVPHRVVCLLGMDDGAFPRRVAPDGDDLLEHDPRVGDRDPRTEDRQLLLDALLAAEEQLVITYAGRDERTNDVRPPAVPIGELLDTVDRTVRTELSPDDLDTHRAGTGDRDSGVIAASRQVTVHHPLHPFDPRNFTPGALGLPDRSFGSDPTELAGARSLIRPDRTRPRTLLPDPLVDPGTPMFTPLDEDIIELDDLVRAVTDPIPTLLAERLQLRFARADGSMADELDVELDGLAGWAVGSRALRDRRDGRDPGRTRTLERARGSVPPGELATPALDEVDQAVDAILALAEHHGAMGEVGAPIDIDVLLGDGRRVVGVVDEVTTRPSGTSDGGPGGVLRQLTYSRLKERDRLHAWVRLLALTATRPDGIWRAATITRVRKGAKARKGEPEPRASAALLAPLATDASSRAAFALRELERLVELRDLAVTRPIPIVTATSAAYADAVVQARGGRRWKPVAQANGRWASNPPFFTGEDADPAHLHAFGPERSIQDLLAVPADHTETGDGWDEAEPSRFGRWALRLWAPLLGHERVEDR